MGELTGKYCNARKKCFWLVIGSRELFAERMFYPFMPEVLWSDSFSSGLAYVRFAGDKVRMIQEWQRYTVQLQPLQRSSFGRVGVGTSSREGSPEGCETPGEALRLRCSKLIASWKERRIWTTSYFCHALPSQYFGWGCWSTSFYSTSSVLLSRNVSTIW